MRWRRVARWREADEEIQKTDVGGNRWREGGGRDLTMCLAYPSLGTSPKTPKIFFKGKIKVWFLHSIPPR